MDHFCDGTAILQNFCFLVVWAFSILYDYKIKSTMRLVLVELISHNHYIIMVLINLKAISVQITTLHMAIFTCIHTIQLLRSALFSQAAWPDCEVFSN